MGERTLTGVLNPANRRYQAYYSQWATEPTDLLVELRRDWRDTHQQDTAALAAALIDPRRVGRHNLCRGHLDEHPDLDLVQLTLLHPAHAAISVYHLGTSQNPFQRFLWALHARHRLAVSADDLFTLSDHDTGATMSCTHCGAVDQIAFAVRHRFGDEPGPEGQRAIATCTGCGSAEITDPHFTVVRLPPPAAQ